MLNNTTILVMAAPIGAGHVLAAEALASELRRKGVGNVVVGSVFDFFPASLGRIFLGFYKKILRYAPCLYRLVYKWGNQSGGSLALRRLVNTVLCLLAHQYIAKLKPTAVIATHATPCGVMDCYKRRYSAEFYLAAVVTDFTVHQWWLYEGTNAYFCAASDMLRLPTLTQGQQLYCYGIPVREQFTHNYDRKALRQEYGYTEKERLCLIMGGGEGLLPMAEIMEALQAKFGAKMRYLALTGHNESLAKELKERFPTERILGYSEQVAPYMYMADYLISKAGGLTAAEALTTGVRYIIYKPLPGQEMANAQYLTQHAAAVVAQDLPSLVELIDSAERGEISWLGSAGKVRATEEIAEEILAALK